VRPGSRTPSRSGRRGVGLLCVIALVVGACSPDAPSATSGPTTAPLATPTQTLYGLNTTVWYAGLELTFTSATAVFDPTGGTVSVLGRFDNPGTDDQQLAAPIRITAGSQGFDPVHGTELPTVPAGGSAPVLISFDVPGRGSVDDAVIRVGRSEDNQALIPFANGPIKPVTLEPVTLEVKGFADAGDLRVVLKAGELRWDLPDWNTELPVGHAALTLTYDAAYRGTFSGGLAFTGDNVSLTLPDGSSVLPRRDGRSQTVTLLLPGKAQPRLSSRFEIPSGKPGTYKLVIHNGSATGTIPFTVPG
jgi:hypothetical protein